MSKTKDSFKSDESWERWNTRRSPEGVPLWRLERSHKPHLEPPPLGPLSCQPKQQTHLPHSSLSCHPNPADQTTMVEQEVFGSVLRFVQDPSSEHLGTTVWDASVVLAKWFEKVCWGATAPWASTAAAGAGLESRGAVTSRWTLV